MSALVPASVSGFSSAWRRLNKCSGMRLTSADLARVATVLGHDTFFTTGNVTPHRRKVIALNTTQSVNIRQDRFHLIDEIKGWDPQEKAQVSFLLAGSLTAHFAQRCLRAPWVMPLKHLVTQANVTFRPQSGKKRPDFVAYTRRKRWHVLESKGRAGSAAAALTDARDQSDVIRLINGRAPSTRVASITHLGGSFWMTIQDPVGADSAAALDVPEDQFWKSYYGWFVDHWSDGNDTPRARREREGFAVVPDHDLGVSVGLWLPTLSWARQGYRGPPPRCKAESLANRSTGVDGFRLDLEDVRPPEPTPLRERLPHARKREG